MLATPTMSSTDSPITGTRVNPVRRASARAWRTVLVRSIQTISVRGTITSRATVSPSSKHRVDHLALGVLDDAAFLREVDELAQLDLGVNGPSRKPWPGVIALPSTIEQPAERPEDLAEHPDGPGDQRADPVRVLTADGARPDADEDVA